MGITGPWYGLQDEIRNYGKFLDSPRLYLLLYLTC